MSQKSKGNIGEKIKMVRMYLEGKISITGLARTMKVDWCTAAAWVRNYEAKGVDAFLPNKIHAYSVEIKRQAVEEYQRKNRGFCRFHLSNDISMTHYKHETPGTAAGVPGVSFFLSFSSLDTCPENANNSTFCLR